MARRDGDCCGAVGTVAFRSVERVRVARVESKKDALTRRWGDDISRKRER